MSPAEVTRITDRLPRGRTLFYDFEGRYALLLLKYFSRDGDWVKHVKRGPAASLLNRPAVREVIARCGDGRLSHAALDAHWPEQVFAYRLTLGRWPNVRCKWDHNYHQMARRGENLVLQLNFSHSDQRLIRRFGTEWEIEPGNSHPVAPPPETTLAWARLDLDFRSGEALIEELQSDWARETETLSNEQARPADLAPLRRHARHWPETMLTAAIWFCVEELGLRRVFLYDADTGARFKGFKHNWQSRPPRSLYTTLPRRFCLKKTAAGPLFLRDARERRLRRAVRDPASRWWLLEVPSPPRQTPRSAPPSAATPPPAVEQAEHWHEVDCGWWLGDD